MKLEPSDQFPGSARTVSPTRAVPLIVGVPTRMTRKLVIAIG